MVTVDVPDSLQVIRIGTCPAHLRHRLHGGPEGSALRRAQPSPRSRIVLSGTFFLSWRLLVRVLITRAPLCSVLPARFSCGHTRPKATTASRSFFQPELLARVAGRQRSAAPSFPHSRNCRSALYSSSDRASRAAFSECERPGRNEIHCTQEVAVVPSQHRAAHTPRATLPSFKVARRRASPNRRPI